MKRTWWKEAVVYQVYWRSFFDSDGDGIGDLQGLIQKLDYIKDLGVDVIWLNPCFDSPDIDNGYDIRDYYAVMEKAGTSETLHHLLAAVHQLGMKLIIDLVVNHTSDQHAWFIESRSSTSNPKRDYYIWRQGTNGQEPNNWRSYFNPSAWTYDEGTGEYYFHSFAVEQPDLNWESPELRKEIYQMMRYWANQGVDGFRMDAIALLAKPSDYPNVEHPENLRYLTNNHGLHTYLREMHEEVLQHYDLLTVGETAFVTPEEGLKYVSEDRRELNMLFHFEVCDEMPSWDLARFREIQNRWYKALWGKGWMAQFLNNHDHTRQVTRYGNDSVYRTESAKLLATMLHTLPGTPYVYQGEEIGMTGVKYDKAEDYRDIAFRNKYEEEVAKGRDPQVVLAELRPLARDNSRTPMQWSGAKNAGFTSGEAWIPVNPNHNEIHVQGQISDPNSVLSYYKALIQLRKENPVMVYGAYEDVSEDHEDVYAYTRTLDSVTWLVVLNHADHENSFEVADKDRFANAKLVIGNYPNDETTQNATLRLILQPYEARVYEVRGAN